MTQQFDNLTCLIEIVLDLEILQGRMTRQLHSPSSYYQSPAIRSLMTVASYGVRMTVTDRKGQKWTRLEASTSMINHANNSTPHVTRQVRTT
jgi:hypothetical protein